MGRKAWDSVFQMPQPGRSMKPRTNGFTMVLDKGLGKRGVKDLMATAADYVDFLKFSFGTSAFYDEDVLREKVSIATEAGVDVYLTGEMSHSAYHQAQELGLNVVFGGHYATETAGLKALADHLAREFGLETIFLDLPTGA